jgi:hypothetical protein
LWAPDRFTPCDAAFHYMLLKYREKRVDSVR